MLDVWRAAAPSIDLLAPDIYLPPFEEVCRSYTRSGNPLFIPEHQPGEASAVNVFTALGRYDALGFAPFGIEDLPATHPIGKSYSLLEQLLPLLAKCQGTGRLAAVVRREADTEELVLGDHRLHVRLVSKERARAAGLVIALEPDEYLVAGWGFAVEFQAREGVAETVGLLRHEEGRYEDGRWVPGPELTGSAGKAEEVEQAPGRISRPLYFLAAVARALSRTSASRTGDPPRRLLS
jgi:hypothetical protein